MTRIQTRMLAVNAVVVLLALLFQNAVADSAQPANDRSEIEWSAASSGASSVLGLPAGSVVTVTFVNAEGDPWPVSELVGPEARWLTVRQAVAHPNVAIVRTGAEASVPDGVSANLVALLAGLSTPVHLTLKPDTAQAPTAVTVRIAEPRIGNRLAGATDAPGADLDNAIRDYLLGNPQVLREALDPARQLASRVSERRDELVGAAGVPALGDLSGGVTVVEFFDYRCGYCKRSLDAVRGALLLVGVRIEMREYPILGDGSVRAARAALAAARQGAYEPAHFALMEHDGEFDAEAIESIMRELGLDLERLTADMESDEIDGLIKANQELAARLGVTGTPAFLVLGPGGVEVSPGALDLDRLTGMINAAG